MSNEDIYPPEFAERPSFDLSEIEGKPSKAKLSLIALGIIIVLFMLYSSIITTVNSALIRHTQTQNKPTLDNTNALVAQQKDCLQPTGTCFKESQQRLAQVLGSVRASNIQVSAASAACAVAMQSNGIIITYDKMTHCISQSLASSHTRHRQ